MAQFEHLEALHHWLNESGVDVSDWGVGGSKTVKQLWDELQLGDCTVQLKPAQRIVNVLQLSIRKGASILLEVEQEFGSGLRRQRQQPPSEKMKPGESCQEAAERCLAEELGVDKTMARFDASSCRETTSTAESPSYPGLLTQYNFHTIEAAVDGLPEHDFWRENIAYADNGDPIKRHRWGWRPAIPDFPA